MTIMVPSTSSQRNIVLVVVSLVLASLIVSPSLQAAYANGTGGTFACTRQTVTLWNGNGTNTSGNTTPCLSGVKFNVDVPYASASTTRATIASLYALQNNYTIKTANNTSIAGAYHIAFNSFNVVNGGAGYNTTLVIPKLAANFTGGLTAPSYGLDLRTDAGSFPTIGGNGVLTDLVVDGDSSYVRLNNTGLCLIIFQGNGCQVAVSTFGSLSWILNGSNFNLAAIHLEAYYGVTHNNTGGAPTGSSIKFPNATLTVN